MTNPFEEMNKYTKEQLDVMSLDELLKVQRSILFPSEQKLFDEERPIFLPRGDKREGFLDYTDNLICNLQMKKGE